MSESQEKPVRVSNITHDRLKYLAGALALSQGEVIEIAILKLMNDKKEELDAVSSAISRGTADEITSARVTFMEGKETERE